MTKKMATGLHSPVLANGGYPIVDGYVTSFDTMTHNVGSPPPMVGVGLLGRWKSICMPQGVYPGVWKCIYHIIPATHYLVAGSAAKCLGACPGPEAGGLAATADAAIPLLCGIQNFK